MNPVIPDQVHRVIEEAVEAFQIEEAAHKHFTKVLADIPGAHLNYVEIDNNVLRVGIAVERAVRLDDMEINLDI